MSNNTNGSIFANVNNGNGKKSWTKEEQKLMIGLKLLGVRADDIATVVGHPKLSVDYKYRALRSKYMNNEGELLKFFGVESTDELKEYAEAKIAEAANDDSSDEDVA
jgi:hypothetical protein